MQKFKVNRDDRAIGAAVVAAVFAAVGAGMSWVMWDFYYSATGGVFVVLWLAIFGVLSLGWRELPPPGPGGGKAPTVGDHQRAGTVPTPSTTTHSAARSAPTASTSAAAAAASPSGAAQAPGSGPADPPATEKAVTASEAGAAASGGSGGSGGAAASEADVGTKPQLMDAPRGEGADDLKQIKGVGPALEKLCNSLGIYHFDQIASWTADEVAWVDEHLEGFKGRVSRDNWVEQAKTLASGGSTEFSQKVEKGDVY
jgi:predicted flap endonuclease-1-like 5' DNA nuclease